MEPSAAAPHDAVLPRWPVFLRFGDNDEVLVGDVEADSTGDLLRRMAGLLREVADHLEDRVRTL